MISAREALERLRDGNRRFATDGAGTQALTNQTRRSALANSQEPFAIILGCSDSRVPAEIVFDQGLGDLFVIRVAGNIVAPGTSWCWAIPSAEPSWRPWRSFSNRRPTSREICVPSSIACGRRWNHC
jgi:hypothetical protein